MRKIQKTLKISCWVSLVSVMPCVSFADLKEDFALFKERFLAIKAVYNARTTSTNLNAVKVAINKLKTALKGEDMAQYGALGMPPPPPGMLLPPPGMPPPPPGKALFVKEEKKQDLSNDNYEAVIKECYEVFSKHNTYDFDFLNKDAEKLEVCTKFQREMYLKRCQEKKMELGSDTNQLLSALQIIESFFFEFVNCSANEKFAKIEDCFNYLDKNIDKLLENEDNKENFEAILTKIQQPKDDVTFEIFIERILDNTELFLKILDCENALRKSKLGNSSYEPVLEIMYYLSKKEGIEEEDLMRQTERHISEIIRKAEDLEKEGRENKKKEKEIEDLCASLGIKLKHDGGHNIFASNNALKVFVENKEKTFLESVLAFNIEDDFRKKILNGLENQNWHYYLMCVRGLENKTYYNFRKLIELLDKVTEVKVKSLSVLLEGQYPRDLKEVNQRHISSVPINNSNIVRIVNCYANLYPEDFFKKNKKYDPEVLAEVIMRGLKDVDFLAGAIKADINDIEDIQKAVQIKQEEQEKEDEIKKDVEYIEQKQVDEKKEPGNMGQKRNFPTKKGKFGSQSLPTVSIERKKASSADKATLNAFVNANKRINTNGSKLLDEFKEKTQERMERQIGERDVMIQKMKGDFNAVKDENTRLRIENEQYKVKLAELEQRLRNANQKENNRFEEELKRKDQLMQAKEQALLSTIKELRRQLEEALNQPRGGGGSSTIVRTDHEAEEALQKELEDQAKQLKNRDDHIKSLEEHTRQLMLELNNEKNKGQRQSNEKEESFEAFDHKGLAEELEAKRLSLEALQLELEEKQIKQMKVQAEQERRAQELDKQEKALKLQETQKPAIQIKNKVENNAELTKELMQAIHVGG